MLQEKWKTTDEGVGDWRTFERKIDNTIHHVRLLRSNSHPSFRSKLQNFIFSLSVLRSEESIDIANDIYQVALPTKASKTNDSISSNRSEIRSLTLCNCTSKTINLRFDEIWDSALEVNSNEQVMIFPNLNALAEPELKIHDHEIEVTSKPSGSAKIFQVANSENQSTIPEIVAVCFASIDLDSNQTQQLEATIGRAKFELSDTKISEENKSSVLKAVAYLTTSLATYLEDDELHHQRLWNASYEILGSVGGCIELFPNAKSDFFKAAKKDDANAPSETLSWLMNHVRKQLC